MKDRRQGDSNSTNLLNINPQLMCCFKSLNSGFVIGVKPGEDETWKWCDFSDQRSYTIQVDIEVCLNRVFTYCKGYLYLMSKMLNMRNPFTKETPTSPNIFQAIPLWNAFMTIWLSPLFYTLYYIPVVMGLAHLCSPKMCVFTAFSFQKDGGAPSDPRWGLWGRWCRRWWWGHPADAMDEPCWHHIYSWLVVEPTLWKICKSVGMIIPNIWKNKTCSKPPTRNYLYEYMTKIQSQLRRVVQVP